MMEIRRRNFVHPRAASKDYPVRSSHIISNVRIDEHDEAGGTLTVSSNFHCAMFYNDKQTLYAGTYEHRLLATDDGFRIRAKRVNLINCDSPPRHDHRLSLTTRRRSCRKLMRS